MRNLSTSLWLMFVIILIVCGIYPLILWGVGQTMFRFQANGSMLTNSKGQVIGSKLIAQNFNNPEYFHSRPSAANYDAAASSSSSLAASNYALRNRVARMLGPIASYYDGRPVAPDIDTWFAQDRFIGQIGIVAYWAQNYTGVAQDWVNSDAVHTAYVENWIEQHPELIEQYIIDNGQMLVPTVSDLAEMFFKSFSKNHPGKFPVLTTDANGISQIVPADSGIEIQATFFDMWRTEHKDARLKFVQADMVTTSASGLDPHITLKNALQQLDRVSDVWSTKLQRSGNELQQEIKKILLSHVTAPIGGLIGEDIVNVLEVNLALDQRYN